MDEYEKLCFTVWSTRAAMLTHASRETCILATRMVDHIVGELLGMRTLPIAVGVLGLNPIAAAKIEAGEDFEGVDGAMALACLHRGAEENEATVGDWWGGHLMCIIDGKYLVDPSADQFSEPAEAIIVAGPMIAEAEGKRRSELAKFAEGDTHLTFGLPEGALIDYEPHPEDLSYMDSMDWEETKPGDKFFDFVFETVEGLLDLYADAPSLPFLPELPPALSKRTASPEELKAADAAGIKALGYSKEEIDGRTQREYQREIKRVSKAASKKFAAAADGGKETVARLRELAGAIEGPARSWPKAPSPPASP